MPGTHHEQLTSPVESMRTQTQTQTHTDIEVLEAEIRQTLAARVHSMAIKITKQ